LVQIILDDGDVTGGRSRREKQRWELIFCNQRGAAFRIESPEGDVK
jgi:hypothetical protein